MPAILFARALCSEIGFAALSAALLLLPPAAFAQGSAAGSQVSSWNGLLVPAKTPPEIISKLHRETVRILALAEVRAVFAAQAAQIGASTPEEFRAYIGAEIEKWGRIVKASGARID